MPQPKCGHSSGIDVPKLIRVCMDLPLSEQIAAVLVLVRTAERTAEIPGSTFLSLSATVATIARGAIPVALPLGADRIMDSMRLSVNSSGVLSQPLWRPIGRDSRHGRAECSTAKTFHSSRKSIRRKIDRHSSIGISRQPHRGYTIARSVSQCHQPQYRMREIWHRVRRLNNHVELATHAATIHLLNGFLATTTCTTQISTKTTIGTSITLQRLARSQPSECHDLEGEKLIDTVISWRFAQHAHLTNACDTPKARDWEPAPKSTVGGCACLQRRGGYH